MPEQQTTINQNRGQAEPVDANSIAALRSRFHALRSFYLRFEHYAQPVLFIAGFLWDALTISRVDNLPDHIFIGLYLTLVGIMIHFTIRRQIGATRPRLIERTEAFFPAAMQFFMGGLFSTFVILYFRSVSWTRTIVFFTILVILFVANEFLRDRLQNMRFLAGLYFLCLFSYLQILLPTLFARLGTGMFLLAGLASLALFTIFFGIFPLQEKQGRWARMRVPCSVALGMYLLINALYFSDLIPPVPLALKSAGIYHGVTRSAEGYKLNYVAPPLYRFWRRWDSVFFLSEGETAFCYTAIFAPRRLHVPVRHIWSYHNQAKGWTVTDRITYEVAGGREGGFRGFTRKRNLTPGLWRVAVETFHGKTLGHIDFAVVPSPDPHPPLETLIIP